MAKRNRKQPPAGEKEHPLLEGEKISFDDDGVKPKATDEELNSRYAKGEIRIVTEQARYPLAGIMAAPRVPWPRPCAWRAIRQAWAWRHCVRSAT